jgi:hypothetical protein
MREIFNLLVATLRQFGIKALASVFYQQLPDPTPFNNANS